MNKTIDIGEGIGVELRRITYQSMEKIREVFQKSIARTTEKKSTSEDVAVSISSASEVWKAEQELLVLVCKSVTFTDDAGEVVRVDMTANPERVRELPYNTLALLMRSKDSPLALSAKPSP